MPEPRASNSGVFVTVAVCTYNRAHLLRQTLTSLTELRVPDSLSWELLIVDNNCTDGTAELCASFESRLPIRVVREAAPGIANARNRALQSARGTYLLFTDDDVRVYPDWLQTFIDATVRHPNAAVFGGPIEPDFPAEPDPDLVAAFPALGQGFCGLDHELPEGLLPPGLPIWTANTGYKLSDARRLAYNPKLGRSPTSRRGGEEIAFLRLMQSHGAEVIWVPTLRVRHYVDPSRMTLDYLISFQIGIGEECVYQENSASDPCARIFGVPRWLLIKALRAYGVYLVASCLSSRREALQKLSKYCYLRGMLNAFHAEKNSARRGEERRVPPARLASSR